MRSTLSHLRNICAVAIMVVVASPGQATGWLVYNGTSAGAYAYSASGPVADNKTGCSGSLASKGYCGDDAVIFADRTKLTENSYAQSLHDTSSSSGYGDVTSSAFGEVDLTTGSLKLSHSTTVVNGFGAGESNYSGAAVSYLDTLHFSGLVTPVTLTVDLRVDGSFVGFTQPRFAFRLGGLNTGIVGWGETDRVGPSTTRDAGGFIDFEGHTGRAGDWAIYGPDRFVGSILLDPLNPDYYIGMDLSAGGPLGTWSNFAHTAKIAFVLPVGVTFTSDSGAFLTATSSPSVPEPATWAMMLAGLGIVGASLRQRRAGRALA